MSVSLSLTHGPLVFACSHCIQQILEAVLHCHQMGVVHRDLKVSRYEMRTHKLQSLFVFLSWWFPVWLLVMFFPFPCQYSEVLIKTLELIFTRKSWNISLKHKEPTSSLVPNGCAPVCFKEQRLLSVKSVVGCNDGNSCCAKFKCSGNSVWFYSYSLNCPSKSDAPWTHQLWYLVTRSKILCFTWSRCHLLSTF